jgi:hypothetical protein
MLQKSGGLKVTRLEHSGVDVTIGPYTRPKITPVDQAGIDVTSGPASKCISQHQAGGDPP